MDILVHRAIAGAPVSRLAPRRLRLPDRLADFSDRGFRIDLPRARAELETHARSFLTGFNIAVENWRDPHQRLAALPECERGFAYEGAAMHAALRDRLTAGRAAAFRRLVAGPGEGYVHLAHVGYGWALTPLRVPLPVMLPGTPLLRWLALDGAGFGEVYFGGRRALLRRCAGAPTERRQAVVAGCGRALWFLESADPRGIALTIGEIAEAARPHLWAGIGLACCYAGGADESDVDDLVHASGPHWRNFHQGAVFGIAARVRARIVPAHTEHACRRLFSRAPEVVAGWTDEAADGLTKRRDLLAYTSWKSRLCDIVGRYL